MLRYVGRRLLQMIPVFFGATFLIYALVFAMPGDPVQALGGDKPLPPATVAQIRHQFNLDQPLVMQYLLYLKGIFTLDFGKTFNGREVTDVMAAAFPVTVQLAIMAIIIESVVGITLGFFVGRRRGGVFDSTVLVASLIVISAPTFVLGFLLQYVFGIQLKLFPPTVGQNVSIYTLLLPALVLGAVSCAYVIRLTRQEVAENLTADYVRTARAKGLPERRVMTHHVLRNSLIPVATFLGGDLGALMGGAIITEGIFNINGVGGVLYKAIIKGEPATVVSVTTVLVLVYILANLFVDLLYAVLDPRIRYA